MILRTDVIACLLAFGLVACATEGPPPSEELTRARAVVDQADKGGAQRYAAADLQRAHDELSNAEKANAERKFDEARRYAESAEADAEVATARASDGDAQRAAGEVTQGNETLRQESGRGAVTTPAPQ
jgi:hypothetical protein